MPRQNRIGFVRGDQLLDVCLRSGFCGLLGGLLGTSLVSSHGSKIVVSEGSVGGTLFWYNSRGYRCGSSVPRRFGVRWQITSESTGRRSCCHEYNGIFYYGRIC